MTTATQNGAQAPPKGLVAAIGAAIIGAVATVFYFLFLAFLALASMGQSQCLTLINDPLNALKDSGSKYAAAREYFDVFSEDVRLERLENARIIIMTGVDLGMSERYIAIAVAVAIQETNLKNYGHRGALNDHNSCGIFQQQPDQGWGRDCEQVMDIVYASTKFYEALQRVDPPPDMSMMMAGYLVQNPSYSAYVSRWAWDDVATQTVDMFLENDPRNAMCYSGVNAQGWRLPLDEGYSITSPFGMRWDATRGNHMHNGIDLATPLDNPIYAVNNGTVSFAGFMGSYGYHIEIDHGGGITSTYSHMRIPSGGLSEGDTVTSGQIIGTIGMTGRTSGPHLHFEVKQDGAFIDPAGYMESVGLKF